MVRTWKIGATGSLLIGLAVLASCSDSGDDGDGSGGKGSGATGGTGGATGGTGGATGGTGGATGGTGGGSGTGGAMGGTAGATTGGTAGAMAGSSGSGGAAGGSGFSCKGTMATCNAIKDFPVDPGQWGSGDFHGGVSVFGAGVTRDASTTEVHITGMVGDYGHGFNLWFSFCSDLSAFTGVSFIAKGTTAAAMPNIIQFQLQTNSTYPWAVRPMDMKGGCTAPAGVDPWGVCISPSINVTLGDAAQMVPWAMMMGGMPAATGMWDPANSPKEIVGIQFQFPWATGATPYMVDVIIDDVKLMGAATETDCGAFMASGGAGGMGGAAGAAGSAGTAGAAGSGAGTAGAGGMAGGAGTAGAGGMSGAAGSGAGTAGAGGMAGSAGAGGMAGNN
jgi:hypothetical protein